MIRKVVSKSSGGVVGGAAGASLLTGIGFVTLGPVGAAIGFGIGAIGGTAGGAYVGGKIEEIIFRDGDTK